MADDEYDLIPHRDIIELKKQIQGLKGEKTDSQDKQLKDAIEELSASVNSMIDMFKEALGGVTEEQQEKSAVADEIRPLNEKLDLVIDQQHKIAEGIVALADMITEIKEIKETIIERTTTQMSEPPRPEPMPTTYEEPQQMPPPMSAPAEEEPLRPLPLVRPRRTMPGAPMPSPRFR